CCPPSPCVAKALADSLPAARPVTHFGIGQAKVREGRVLPGRTWRTRPPPGRRDLHVTCLNRYAVCVSTARLRISCVIRIEQNFGPHIEQNFADLNTSCGSVSSCIARAVSGSSDSSNCRFQSNSKRALLNSSSRLRTFLRPR